MNRRRSEADLSNVDFDDSDVDEPAAQRRRMDHSIVRYDPDASALTHVSRLMDQTESSMLARYAAAGGGGGAVPGAIGVASGGAKRRRRSVKRKAVSFRMTGLPSMRKRRRHMPQPVPLVKAMIPLYKQRPRKARKGSSKALVYAIAKAVAASL